MGDLRPGGPPVDEDMLDSLLQGPGGAQWLDPQAVGRVEGRLRRIGHGPRTTEEMAETLRILGDLLPSELSGTMSSLLSELEREGRAVEIDLPGTVEPRRWISAEEVELYNRAFGATTEPEIDSVETIVRRYLENHALIGLSELTRRYPILPELATELLERWAESGRVIRLDAAGEDSEPEPRWADRANLAEIHRLSVAIRRRESVAVRPEVFADFLVRRQHLDPATRREGAAGLEQVLERLQGFAASAAFWENEILPRRVSGYRAAWLDDLLAGGSWLWRAASGGRDEPLVALVPRDFAGDWPSELPPDGHLADEAVVLELLTRRGASFATDLARASGLEPTRLRRALQALVLRGQVTNDRFDPLRPGASALLEALTAASTSVSARSRVDRRESDRAESIRDVPTGDGRVSTRP